MTISDLVSHSLSPASAGQRELYHILALHPGTFAYNLVFCLRYHGSVNTDELRDFFDRLVSRHEICRTSFHEIGGKLFQRVHTDRKAIFHVLERDDWGPGNIHEEVDRLRRKPFNLAEHTFEITLLREDPEHTVLVFCAHHIITDGFSLSLWIDELVGFHAGRPLQALSPLVYRDYVSWSERLQENEAAVRQRDYWTKQLSGCPASPVLSMACKTNSHNYSGDLLAFHLDRDLVLHLKELARQYGISLNGVLLSGFQTLLFRYCRQEDMPIGTPWAGRARTLAGRRRSDFQDTIGYFVNLTLLRAHLEAKMTFADLLKQTGQLFLEARRNQDYPFPKLMETMREIGEPVPHPEVMFVFHKQRRGHRDISPYLFDHQVGTYQINDDLAVEPIYVPQGEGQFDLVLEFLESEQDIYGMLKYKTGVLDKQAAAGAISHLVALLQAAVANPAMPIETLNMIGSGEQSLLDSFNDTCFDTADRLFARCISEYGDERALVFEDQVLSYRELDRRAEVLADRLYAAGVGPETIVGLMLGRGPQVVVAMIAIIKAGGAWLPIDPYYPRERVRYLLDDSRAAVLLTSSEYLETTEFRGQVVLADRAPRVPLAPRQAPPRTQPSQLAYVIYTSGSTGKPNGVLCHHAGLMNMVQACAQRLELGAKDNILQFASISFDASVYEIFKSFYTGGTLVMVSQDTLNHTGRFLEMIERNGVTVVTLPPIYLKTLDRKLPAGVTTVITAGESADPADAAHYAGRGNYFNAYGPTESAVCVSAFKVNSQFAADGPVPIGRPLMNTQLYIRDPSDQDQPVGLPGELCIAGPGLARGYHNKPGLTATRFVPNPQGNGSRLYLTGDLARWSPSGAVIFMGRIDHQVKIRGNRVELGEIEAHLQKMDEVNEAVVLVQSTPTGDLLCAYLVASNPLPHSTIRERMAALVPTFMVPSRVMYLDVLPTTPNGKLDRSALPEPLQEVDAGIPFQPPETALEKRMIVLWEEVLQFKPGSLGIYHNFFDSGGNSALAIRLVSLLEEQLGLDVSLIQIFRHSTVQRLCESLAGCSVDDDNVWLFAEMQQQMPHLFLLPPILGSALCFQPLAMALAGKVNPIGLNYPGAYRAGEPLDNRLETLAERCLNRVKAVQEHGPYLLLGYSMGATVAFEMARQLEREGERSTLILVDGALGTELEAIESAYASAGTPADGLDTGYTPLDKAETRALIAHHRGLLINYQYTMIKAATYCLEAADNVISTRMASWSRFTRGSFQQQMVPGTHADQMRPQKCQATAQRILGIIEGAHLEEV